MPVTLWKQQHLTWYCSILFGNAKLWLIKPSIDNTIVYPFRYTAVQFKTLAFFIANANQCPATSYDLLYHTSHLHYVCPEEVKASIMMLFSYVAMLDRAIHSVCLHFNLATSLCQEYFVDFAATGNRTWSIYSISDCSSHCTTSSRRLQLWSRLKTSGQEPVCVENNPVKNYKNFVCVGVKLPKAVTCLLPLKTKLLTLRTNINSKVRSFVNREGLLEKHFRRKRLGVFERLWVWLSWCFTQNKINRPWFKPLTNSVQRFSHSAFPSHNKLSSIHMGWLNSRASYC